MEDWRALPAPEAISIRSTELDAKLLMLEQLYYDIHSVNTNDLVAKLRHL